MRKDSGIFQALHYCFILASMLCLVTNISLIQKVQGKPGWYSGFAFFANWDKYSNIKVDFSTNTPLTRYYCGSKSKYLRERNILELRERLKNGEVLTMAFDYYIFLPITRPFVPVEIMLR